MTKLTLEEAEKALQVIAEKGIDWRDRQFAKAVLSGATSEEAVQTVADGDRIRKNKNLKDRNRAHKIGMIAFDGYSNFEHSGRLEEASCFLDSIEQKGTVVVRKNVGSKDCSYSAFLISPNTDVGEFHFYTGSEEGAICHADELRKEIEIYHEEKGNSSTDQLEPVMTEKFLSFDEATDLVLQDKDQAAFAFYPHKEKGKVTGGTIFFVERDTNYAEDGTELDDPAYLLDLTGGDFHNSDGVEGDGGLDPEDVMDAYNDQVDIRSLRFKQCTQSIVSHASSYETQISLAIFNGLDEGEAKSIELNASYALCKPVEWNDWLTQHLPK